MAALGVERWLESAKEAENGDKGALDLARHATEAAADPLAKKLLESIFGNSPFLTSVIVKHPEFTLNLLSAGPDDAFEGVLKSLKKESAAPMSEAALASLLREAKSKAALSIAIADITGTWDLRKITAALSDFAEAALRRAAAYVLVEAGAKGIIKIKSEEDPERESGYIIIAMGKLGARELNYSSDIDLIVLYDREKIESANALADADGLQKNMVRMTRDLIRLIDERTVDGYVFRTDLRLRPDPGVTPVALSVNAAETYYETLGQNWERAAMIKARPVAGDIEAGQAFLKRLTPYIWRKNLDFAAIQDIHSIKRQIQAHKGGGEIAVGGHNIKLGRGGIREIEFFAQTQQLIWGGREAGLRSPVTCEALAALAEHGRSDSKVVDELTKAYEFLRRLEHRLQMINDEQTQVLPDNPDELNRVAVFMGYKGAEGFSHDLVGHLSAVQNHYGHLFDDAPSLGAHETIKGGGNLVFTGGDPDPETLATIRGLGFEKPETVDTVIRGWHHGRYRATRSTRAREILTELMPVILKAIGATPAPDAVFLKFDQFLSGLPSGVQLFSMFHSNPQLLDLVAEIMGKAPRLADHLSRQPAILDSVLSPGFFDTPPDKDTLLAELNDLLSRADHIEHVLDISRRWNNDRRFQIGVQCLHGAIEPGDAGRAFSDIAETALGGLFPYVEDEFAKAHGRFPDSGMAVLALGKLGSRELTAASDLDLIFLYAAPGDDISEMSDGPKPLSALQYYGRLSQRLINAVSISTGEGSLYEVDMRLRPSGAKGPIASTLDGFKRYHADDAWTWERMALTRARVLFGPKDLCGRISGVIHDILTQRRDSDELLLDVAAMRDRLLSEHPGTSLWNLKNLRGGLVDIEFMTQYLTLKHAPDYPDILGRDTSATLAALADTGLLDRADSKILAQSLELWRALQGLLALTIAGEITPAREEEMPGALQEDLVRVGGTEDFSALEKKIKETAEAVYEIYKNLIEDPAAVLAATKAL